ncbi:hypothetical protein ACN28I_34085 [Archangium gephyra]|uniref:hypothetical protein n=1 Tax=Archangium gephyra TaxID=48 RepID=UPI003B762320
MQRSRSTVRAPEATGELLADIPEPVSPAELPSPRSLLEEVRTPGAARAEVEALLSGLARPLGPGESARERADLLHEILEDKEVREYSGSGGRKVGHAAVLQLVELGFPYALEVPPELFAEARAAGGGGTSSSGDGSSPRLGVVLSTLAGGLEVLPALLFGFDGRSGDMPVALFWILLVSLTSFVPALLADTEPVVSRRWLHYLLLGAVAVPGLLWLLTTVLVLGIAGMNGSFLALFFLLPLAMAVLRLAGARSLYSPPPGEGPPETPPD